MPRMKMGNRSIGYVVGLFALLASSGCFSELDDSGDDIGLAYSAFEPGKIAYSEHTNRGSKYHLVTVNLAAKGITLRSTKHSERNRTTSSFHNLVKAKVTVNGDWFSGTLPRGLARGEGEQWRNDRSDHSFIACDDNNNCFFDGNGTQTPASKYRTVVGGNYARLLVNGNNTIGNPTASLYRDNTPRTAVGLSQDGKTMYLLTVDQGSNNGTYWTHIADWLKGQGAWNAMMFDGGGSSTMIVDGHRENRLKNGTSTERKVANHFAVLYHNGYFFDDDNHWAESYIEAVRKAGITQGCKGGVRPEYCPEGTVSRYHMAVFLVRAFDLPLNNNNYFDDDDGHNFEQYANALYTAGITTGTGYRTYSGNSTVTRGQMVTFLGRALGLNQYFGQNYFSDDNGRYYEGYANEFKRRGWLNGCGGGKVCGEDAIKRSEVAALLQRSLNLPF